MDKKMRVIDPRRRGMNPFVALGVAILVLLVGSMVWICFDYDRVVKENAALKAENAEWRQMAHPAFTARGWNVKYMEEHGGLKPNDLMMALNPCIDMYGQLRKDYPACGRMTEAESLSREGVPIKITLAY